MLREIYAIYDRKAEDITGPLQMHRNVAVATRAFTDVMLDQQTMINRHPDDFDLVSLGHLAENGKDIIPKFNIIITGKALKENIEAINASLELTKNQLQLEK